MRVTQFTIFNNFILNQQQDLTALTKVQSQLASGRKIEYMYEDPIVFTKDLKFQEEINSFVQIKKSAEFAKTFANETDTVLNEIVSTLDSFKVKLIQAANDTNNVTSRMAIAKELEGELNHLRDLANTSLDGKYIFSGSAFDKAPISEDFKYQGNDKKVKAFLGNSVEREYNIDGKSLFLGRDDDYKKHIGLNVVQYDKLKAFPNYVVRVDGKLYIDKDNSSLSIASTEGVKKELITLNKEDINTTPLRALTGIRDFRNDDGTYTSGINYFFIKGKRSDGSVVNTSFSLSNDDNIQTLLDKIGEIYGNTNTSKNVDVFLNDAGEIQIKDLKTGKMITDFYMVAGGKKDKNQSAPSSLKDLISGGYDIAVFQKSNFNSIRNLTTITANNGFFDNKTFKFFSNFKLIDNSRDALATDKLQDVIGSVALDPNDGNIVPIDHLNLSGTDVNGNSVDVDLSVDSSTTMQDLLDTIKNNFGVDVRLENGEIIMSDTTDNEPSKFSITIKAKESNNSDLEAFRSEDVSNFDQLFFEKSGNLLTSNVSEVLAEKEYIIKDGKLIIQTNENAQHYADENSVVADTVNLSPSNYPQTIELRFFDIDGNFKRAIITLRDEPDSNGHLSTFEIDGNVYDILNENGEKTPAHTHITTQEYLDKESCQLCKKEVITQGVTFKQLADVISMIVTNNLPNDNYQEAIKKAQNKVVAGLDEKGKFFIKDLQNQNSKINFSIFSNENTFYFQANNSLVYDEPEIDFFKTLQDAIDAVKNGINFSNADVDPRNFGIQGAIEAIDHVIDRARREHAKIGAVSQEFDLSISRVDMLKNHVISLQSQNIDTDIGEATMKLTSIQTSYQALLASIAKINNLTLLNYLR